MARFVQFLLFIELILIIPSQQSPRHGFDAELLHAANEKPSAMLIEPEMLESFVRRSRRDVKLSPSDASNFQTAKDTSSATSSTKKLPNTSQSSVNVRNNVTITTTNKITTAVSVFYPYRSFSFPLLSFGFTTSVQQLCSVLFDCFFCFFCFRSVFYFCHDIFMTGYLQKQMQTH